MAAACGTAQSQSGYPCATCPLALMLWQHSGAWEGQRNREAGARRAASWSTVTAALLHCAVLCSATMPCFRSVKNTTAMVTAWSGVWLITCFVSSLALQEVPDFPNAAPIAVRVLHPVVYVCTALLLLCLFTIIITHILHHRYFSVFALVLSSVFRLYSIDSSLAQQIVCYLSLF